MAERYLSAEEEQGTASSLIRLTHWYSGTAWIWIVVCSFSSLVWLEVHAQLVVTLLYLATLGFTVLSRGSLRFYVGCSWFMLWTDMAFLLYQIFAAKVNFDASNKNFAYAFPASVLFFFALVKLALDGLILRSQHMMLQVPLEHRLDFPARVIPELSMELKRFIAISVLYSLFLCGDLILSRVLLEQKLPRLVADLTLALQVLMPALLSNLIFKVKRTLLASLVLFALAGSLDAFRFSWMLTEVDEPFSVQGIFRIVFCWLRICVLVVLALILWRLRKPLVLTLKDRKHIY